MKGSGINCVVVVEGNCYRRMPELGLTLETQSAAKTVLDDGCLLLGVVIAESCTMFLKIQYDQTIVTNLCQSCGSHASCITFLLNTFQALNLRWLSISWHWI
jgi:hypothetical protein